MNLALYILMRNDLDSLTSGRKMAQASHASNAFVNQVSPTYNEQYVEWKKSTGQGFGTAIVLSVTEKELNDVVRLAESFGMESGKVVDPCYRVVDGLSEHYLPVVTCGFVFGDRDSKELRELTQHFELS